MGMGAAVSGGSLVEVPLENAAEMCGGGEAHFDCGLVEIQIGFPQETTRPR